MSVPSCSWREFSRISPVDYFSNRPLDKPMKNKPLFLFPSTIAASFILLSPALHADFITWDAGGGDNNWSTLLNWSDDASPNGDDVTFDANGALASGTTNTVSASRVGGLSYLRLRGCRQPAHDGHRRRPDPDGDRKFPPRRKHYCVGSDECDAHRHHRSSHGGWHLFSSRATSARRQT